MLAAQMGYLPGMLWILAGVVFAGAVQDFTILFISTRRDGRSLGDLVKSELGKIPGVIALFGAFMIMVIILAVLALIVVKALTHSPWGTFTVAATIPIALFMGVYLRYIRPGKIGEVSIIGFVGLMAAITFGQDVAAHPVIGPMFDFDGKGLTWILIIYGFIASVLPVWLLLAPRDYLSTFLKIGTIVGLAIGIVVVAPELKMPALTQFVDGTGRCGPATCSPSSSSPSPAARCRASMLDLLGHHAQADRERNPGPLHRLRRHADGIVRRHHGAGGRLRDRAGHLLRHEQPGGRHRHDAGPGRPGGVELGLRGDARRPGPDGQGRGRKHHHLPRGGAPTLAVGMAHILHQAIGGPGMMAFWYHFAILFEALFILTAVDAGTRAGRFMLQDLLGTFAPSLKRTDSLPANLIATALCVAAWGYFLYQGVVDPLGGINTLWPLFGIANQMLAAIALTLGTVVLFKMKRDRYAWVTVLPTLWLLACTLTAGWQKLFHPDPRVSFLAHADKYNAAIAEGKVLAPAKSLAEMSRVVMNDYINAGLCAIFIFVVVSIVVFGLRSVQRARNENKPTARETPYETLPVAAAAGAD